MPYPNRSSYQRLLSVFLAALLLVSSIGVTDAQARTGTEVEEEPAGAEQTSPSLPLFGVQMYGHSGTTSPYFSSLVESGAYWIRIPFAWKSVEPENHTPAQYNWTSADRAVAAAADLKAQGRDVNIILTFDDAPEWAATYRQGPIDKVPLARLAEFMGAVVERYNGNGINDAPGSPVVNYFEFYNEPDRFCGGAFAWGADGDKYAEMLKTVYPVVKAANPNAKIVFGGIAYDNFSSVNKQTRQCTSAGLLEWPIKGGSFTIEFLDDVLSTCGTDDCFDVMNFHVYAEFAPNWTQFGANGLSLGVSEKTNYIRNKLAEYGMGDKPIIITEAGKHSNSSTGDISATPAMQAQHVVVFFTQAMAANVQAFTWWMLYDLPLNVYPMQTGLVTADGTKKPAFNAYKTMVSQFKTAKFERALTETETGRPLDSFPNMEAYKFSDTASGQTLYIAWLNPMWVEGNPSLPLTLAEKKVVVLDIYGNVKQIVADSDDGNVDGQVTVQVSGEPVYIKTLMDIFLPQIAR